MQNIEVVNLCDNIRINVVQYTEVANLYDKIRMKCSTVCRGWYTQKGKDRGRHGEAGKSPRFRQSEVVL